MSTTRARPTRSPSTTLAQIQADFARKRTRRIAKLARQAFATLFEEHALGDVTVRGVTKARGPILVIQSAAFDSISHLARQDFAWTALTANLDPADVGRIADVLVLDSRGGQAPPQRRRARRT
jgi:hypothetical protein